LKGKIIDMKIENIGWSIGNFCNAKCHHCYSWRQRQGHEILSLDEIDTILDKIISYGIKTVNFGGNEPIFTNGKDLGSTTLPYIIDRLYERNIICGITTNGFTEKYLYENHFDTFMKVNDWDFSLDAPCSKEHNKNRNVSNAFEMVLEGLDICTKHKRLKSIVVAGMHTNLKPDVLNQFITLAQKYEADFRINILKPTEEHHKTLLPSVEKIYESMDWLLEKMDMVCMSESIFASQVGIGCNGSPCGEKSFRIRTKINGRVPITPCVYLDLDAGDILSESIDSIVSGAVFSCFIHMIVS
jgi:MoaA/NifB/PqqE/SkfB family radical SAM enzyme